MGFRASYSSTHGPSVNLGYLLRQVHWGCLRHVVPSVAASDRGPRFGQRRGGEEGLDCFSFYLTRLLLVILQDFCAVVSQAKVLYVIVPIFNGASRPFEAFPVQKKKIQDG
jgi:hypothetical protein